MTSGRPDTDPPREPVAPGDSAAKQQLEQTKDALDNVREGYGNDRAAGSESGMGSRSGARDDTSGRRSGNQ